MVKIEELDALRKLCAPCTGYQDTNLHRSETPKCHLTVLHQGEHIQVRHVQETASPVLHSFIQVLVVFIFLQRNK
jgi:hypothetical protein